MANLIKLSEFVKSHFVEGSAPTKRTLRKMIDEKELPGRRIGNVYYVDLQRFEGTGNANVDRVLGV